MREILFRGKRKDNGKWVYGFYHNETSIESHSSDRKITRHHIYTQDFDRFVNAETVGQYTGLTDKNGKKIFEGDILKTPCWYTRYDYPCVCIYREEHQTGSIQGFGLYHKINDWVELVDTDEWDEFEVIGNIHDNPELLEEQK